MNSQLRELTNYFMTAKEISKKKNHIKIDKVIANEQKLMCERNNYNHYENKQKFLRLTT